MMEDDLVMMKDEKQLFPLNELGPSEVDITDDDQNLLFPFN